MKYGYFDDEKREYVITDPRTPVKWINYVGTLDFGGFVDHTGGSLICQGDPATNRITKYIPQLPNACMKGETAYLRLKKEGQTIVFSPYFVPTLDAFDRYECRVGLQYSRIISEIHGIRSEIVMFVPYNDRRLIRSCRFTNLTDQPVELDFIPVVEYTHPDALKQFTNADWIPQTMQSRLADDCDGLKIITQYPFMLRESRVNYFTSNAPVSSFETDRRLFLGDNEYGTWAHPLALDQDELSNTQALRGDNICALMHHLGSLQPNKSSHLITQLGQAQSLEAAMPGIEKYRDPHNVENALTEITDFWQRTLSRFQVQTPDAAMNTMVNIHNPRQCYITKNWSRYLSLYQLGLGARGMGFRDSSQDVMGILGLVPCEGRDLIRKLLHVQKRDGSAMHQFNPASMVANEGDARFEEDRPSYYGDDHLWVVLATCAYIKETGDCAFLEQEIPFYEKSKKERPIESASVLEHLRRAIEFTRSNTGRHGLPLLGFADWNDTVNLPEGAESLFIAHLYGTALNEMIDLMEARGETEAVEHYRTLHAEMKERVNQYAWDGDWYLRYFDHLGQPIGTHTNPQGRIYTNAQSWAVISGFATDDRAKQALQAVFDHLNTRNGIKLSTPGYDRYDPEKGGITTYPPGAKENGGIFLHANPWVMIAETLRGNGDRAFQYYNQINPATRNERIEEFECAPYNYPQNILGDEHPQFGLARNSWLSGTSSWTYQAATQYILGIRPAHNGLLIDPCIPAQWDGFTATRFFRGATYRITVSNPDHVSHGIRETCIDGTPAKSNLIPIFNDGTEHIIQIVLAAPVSTHRDA
jgi:cellobiose phosphorylase